MSFISSYLSDILSACQTAQQERIPLRIEPDVGVDDNGQAISGRTVYAHDLEYRDVCQSMLEKVYWKQWRSNTTPRLWTSSHISKLATYTRDNAINLYLANNLGAENFSFGMYCGWVGIDVSISPPDLESMYFRLDHEYGHYRDDMVIDRFFHHNPLSDIKCRVTTDLFLSLYEINSRYLNWIVINADPSDQPELIRLVNRFFTTSSTDSLLQLRVRYLFLTELVRYAEESQDPRALEEMESDINESAWNEKAPIFDLNSHFSLEDSDGIKNNYLAALMMAKMVEMTLPNGESFWMTIDPFLQSKFLSMANSDLVRLGQMVMKAVRNNARILRDAEITALVR